MRISHIRHVFFADLINAQGSVRHNLSLNQVFRNVHRPITERGKGNYWEIDPTKGEGYKRDRKRRSRKRTANSSSITREDNEDEDQDGIDGMGIGQRDYTANSDYSDEYGSPNSPHSSLPFPRLHTSHEFTSNSTGRTSPAFSPLEGRIVPGPAGPSSQILGQGYSSIADLELPYPPSVSSTPRESPVTSVGPEPVSHR